MQTKHSGENIGFYSLAVLTKLRIIIKQIGS